MDEAKEYREGIGIHTITAEEAQIKYGRTISYEMHKFFCKYCGEDVTFVQKSKKKPYFMHMDENEETKACDLRVGKNDSISLYEKLGPPLYLTKIVENKFRLNIGFSGTRGEFNEILKDYNPELIVGKEEDKLNFSLKEFNEKEMNLKCLNIVSSRYSIHYEPKKDLPKMIQKRFSDKWGDKIEGIGEKGSLFHKKGEYHRKIRRNDQVSLFEDYLLVSCDIYDLNKISGVILEEIGELSINNSYKVYNIRFEKMKDSDYRKIKEILKIILVEKLEEIFLIWPPAIENDNIISTIEDKRNIFLVKNKEERTKIYKHEGTLAISVPIENLKNCFLCEIKAREKDNQITINDEYGSIYLVLNKCLKKIEGYKSSVELFDEENNILESGDYTRLPLNKKIKVKGNRKITIVHLKKNKEIISYKITNKEEKIIDNIKFGDKIYQVDGIEKKLLLSFEKDISENKEEYNYDLIYRKIYKEKGNDRKVPIWIRNILYSIPSNTRLYNLIKKYIHRNKIPLKSEYILKMFFKK